MRWTSEVRQEVGSSRQITRKVHTMGGESAPNGISAQGTVYVKVSVKKGGAYLGKTGTK